MRALLIADALTTAMAGAFLIAMVAALGCMIADYFQGRIRKIEDREDKNMNQRDMRKIFIVHGDVVDSEGNRWSCAFDNRRDAFAVAWGILGMTGRPVKIKEIAVGEDECGDGLHVSIL